MMMTSVRSQPAFTVDDMRTVHSLLERLVVFFGFLLRRCMSV